MSIPFANLFQKLRGGFRSSPPPAGGTETPRPAPVEKKTGEEKLSKTVLPNTTRTVAPMDPFDLAAGASPRLGAAATIRPGTSAARLGGLPPAVAISLEPKVERSIALQLSDVLAAVPREYIKPAETIDGNRAVLLRATEIEKGMATGKPSISLASLYEQVPEIFLRSVPESEVIQVPLPMDKVLEQISNVRVREDQERDNAVPQVNTPFLQATIEDTEKFGTSMTPIETSALPPVKVEPASAQSFANAEPETAVREPRTAPVAQPKPAAAAPAPAPPLRTPITLNIPSPTSTPVPTPPPAEAAKPAPTPNEPEKPIRVPFQLSPNGTDVSASERVPASSGPSVPIRLPKPPVSPPLKVTPPSDSLRPKLTLVPGVEAPGGEPVEDESQDFPRLAAAREKEREPKISLRLLPILENLPPFQLNGTPSTVPAEVEIEFPLSLIQPQLAIGRITIAPKIFQRAMPRKYRDLLAVDESETPIQLPLQEVLRKIPTTALQMRSDQEEAEKGAAFETPFSLKAKEDAARFQAETVKAVTSPEQPVASTPEAKTAKPAEAAPATPADQAAAAIKTAVESGEPPKSAEQAAAPVSSLDAKEVVARASQLPGVVGCLVAFADGLSLAGNLPEDLAVGGLCAMAPSLLQRIEKHMLDTKLGAMNALTLHGENTSLSFFRDGSIYLAALHQGPEQLSPETNSQLFALTKDLSRNFAQPETTNVHH